MPFLHSHGSEKKSSADHARCYWVNIHIWLLLMSVKRFILSMKTTILSTDRLLIKHTRCWLQWKANALAKENPKASRKQFLQAFEVYPFIKKVTWVSSHTVPFFCFFSITHRWYFSILSRTNARKIKWGVLRGRIVLICETSTVNCRRINPFI